MIKLKNSPFDYTNNITDKNNLTLTDPKPTWEPPIDFQLKISGT